MGSRSRKCLMSHAVERYPNPPPQISPHTEVTQVFRRMSSLQARGRDVIPFWAAYPNQVNVAPQNLKTHSEIHLDQGEKNPRSTSWK